MALLSLVTFFFCLFEQMKYLETCCSYVVCMDVSLCTKVILGIDAKRTKIYTIALTVNLPFRKARARDIIRALVM